MALSYVLVDLDNTIYPASSGLLDEIGERMTECVAKLFDVPWDEAAALRSGYRVKYGATLTGLLAEGGLKDAEAYLEAVHPKDLSPFLSKDPDLLQVLASIALPLAILTNSPAEHARRVVAFLAADRYFRHIFDIRYNAFEGKPSKQLYRKVLKAIDRKADEVLLVDDHVDYLESFRDLGGKVALVREKGAGGPEADGIPILTSLKELPVLLGTLARDPSNSG